MVSIPKISALFETSLSSSLSAAGTSFSVVSGTDRDGNALSGLYGFVIDEGSADEEFVVGTISSTTVTITKRGCDADAPESEISANKKAHRRGASVKITDYPILAYLRNALAGEIGYELPALLKLATGVGDPTDDNHLARKAYVDSVVAGSFPANRIVVAGNAGETVAAGNLVYLDDTDNEWKKTDADTSATVENVILGIAQGAGTNGNAISNGVLLLGLDTNNTGLVDGQTYYASNTAGALATSPGTIEVPVGMGTPTGNLYFIPRFAHFITEDQQDALAGTSGTPSNSNKFVTNDDSAENTASKLVRRKSNSNITVPATPTDTTDAASKSYVDTTAGPLNRVVGVGSPTATKAYINFTIPYVTSTNVPSGDFWTFVNYAATGGKISFYQGTSGSDTASSVITSSAIMGRINAPNNTSYFFGTGKDIYVEWMHGVGSSGNEQMGWGLTQTVAPFSDFDDQTVDAACFTVDASGNLYAHTSNAGVGHTETQITGVTLAQMNRYRIEFEAGVEARFYVNGILKATITTNLPDGTTGGVFFGFGTGGNTGDDDVVTSTEPNFAVEI